MKSHNSYFCIVSLFCRKSLWPVLAGLLLTAGLQCAGAAGEEKPVLEADGQIEKTPPVGTKWTYQHFGMRTSGNIGMPVNGDRVREIVAVHEKDGVKLWESQETWGVEDIDPVRIFYDNEGLVQQIEQGAEYAILNPPVAFDYPDMKPGEVKEFETVEKTSEGDIRVQAKVTRLLDETIDTPSGVYKNCLKSQIAITCYHPKFNNSPFQLLYMCWYHPKANGMVKESFKGNPPVNGGEWKEPLFGVSLLKSYAESASEGGKHVQY